MGERWVLLYPVSSAKKRFSLLLSNFYVNNDLNRKKVKEKRAQHTMKFNNKFTLQSFTANKKKVIVK